MKEEKVLMVRNYFKCPICGSKIYVISITNEILQMQCRDSKCKNVFVERRKA